MTKKDYELIADVLAGFSAEYRHGSRPTHREIVESLAYAFATVNPKFDWSKFAKACGLAD